MANGRKTSARGGLLPIGLVSWVNVDLIYHAGRWWADGKKALSLCLSLSPHHLMDVDEEGGDI